MPPTPPPRDHLSPTHQVPVLGYFRESCVRRRTLGCRPPYSFVRLGWSWDTPGKVKDVALNSPSFNRTWMHKATKLLERMSAFAHNARRWTCCCAPLWLVLLAFAGQATLPSAVVGSLLPRESEEESDSLEEAWKCNAGEARGCPAGRANRRSVTAWAKPADCLQCVQPRPPVLGAAASAWRSELDQRNGWGGPLRC
jgi:hypothetical protein